MPDVRLHIIRNEADISTDGADVEYDSGLTTAVLLSLMSDCSADGGPGWWGDIAGLGPVLFASRIHAIRKNDHQSRNRIVDFIHEALQWMLDDGIVDDISVRVELNSAEETQFLIRLREPEARGGRKRSFIYARNWQGQQQSLEAA